MKHRDLSVLALAGASALLVVAAANAAGTGSDHGELNASVAQLTKFDDFDKNKDGMIAKDEIPANDELAQKFASFDTNNDGKLSKEEFSKYSKADQRVARAKKPASKKQ